VEDREVMIKGKLAEYIRELKDKCSRCGVTDKDVLLFHHINPGEKECDIRATLSREKIAQEAEKCEILCFNCHMKHHRKHPAGVMRKARKKKEPASVLPEPTAAGKIIALLESLPNDRLRAIHSKCAQILSDRAERPMFLPACENTRVLGR
jgi:hypothetical protein